jgi:NADPH:quinone reductase-like Zn-dependent oxidoreductase
MKAIVQDRYGSGEVLEEREIDRPEIGDNEVLVLVTDRYPPFSLK